MPGTVARSAREVRRSPARHRRDGSGRGNRYRLLVHLTLAVELWMRVEANSKRRLQNEHVSNYAYSELKYICEHSEAYLSDNTSRDLGARERQVIGRAKGVLLDWDGCIAIENQILPRAGDLIAMHCDKVAIVSNNSTHLPADFVDFLSAQGIDFAPERVFLAGAAALQAMACDKDARVLLLSVPRMHDYAHELGVVLDNRNPNVVLIMRDSSFSYPKLELAANALKAGARLIAANADLSHPGSDNRIVPETGALLAALLACSNNPEMSWQLIGKPGPLLFSQACETIGIAASDAVMIGDNPQTDGEGAANAGIQSILVGRNSLLSLEHLVEHDCSLTCGLRSKSLD